MPHLILEHSNNLPVDVDVVAVLGRLHQALAAVDTFNVDDIKSRAVAHDRFVVGAGAPDGAFVHVSVAILGGRDLALQQHVSATLMAVLQEAFAPAFAGRPCALSVEVREMRRETYVKAPVDPARTG